MAGPPKLFNLKHSLLNEMSNLQALMKSDPEKGKEILLLGEALIQHANQGLLRKFIAAATELSRSEGPLLYFLTKGLIDALKRGHLMIASFVLDNGFNLHDPHLPHVLNTVLKDDVVTDNVALIAVQLLQRYQYDFNLQERETYWAPLHYAVQRSFVRTVEHLVAVGADVNVVADKDVMPLNIALQVVANPPVAKSAAAADRDDDSDDKHAATTAAAGLAPHLKKDTLDDDTPELVLAKAVVEVLLKSGAKETWRRGIAVSTLPQNETFSAIGAPRESCSIVAAPSSSSSSAAKAATSASLPPAPPAKANVVRFSSASLAAATPSNDTPATPPSGAFVFSTTATAAADAASAMRTAPSMSGRVSLRSGNRLPFNLYPSDRPPSSEAAPAKPSDSDRDAASPAREDAAAGLSAAQTTTTAAAAATTTTTGTAAGATSASSAASSVFLGESDDGRAFLFSTGD
eukprot:gene6886-4959_t